MKAIIIEDSRLARQGLLRMLGDYADIEVVALAENAEIALEQITEHQPDVIFLDIHMPGESGFELLQALELVPKIIFTTAYAEYAIQSFDYPTVDYLLKPVSKERLAQAVDKLRKVMVPTLVSEAENDIERQLELNSKILIKDGEECHLVNLADIYYIESCKNHVRAFFKDKKAFIRKNMAHVDDTLPSSTFFRANRQAIINLNFIEVIEPSISEGYDIKLKGGILVEVSRRNAAKLKEMLSL